MPDKRHYPSDVNLSSTFTDIVHLPSEFNLSDSEVAAILAQQLGKYFRPEEIAEAQAKYIDKGWPEEYVNNETGKRYKPHHLLEAKILMSDTPTYLLAAGGEGGGKALALDTPLPTPTGWTMMSDVSVGDFLLDNFGFPCRVTAVSPVMYDHRCYRVTFNDGQSIIADAGHLWFTLNSDVRKSLERRGSKRTTGTHRDSPQCQPKHHPRLCTTEELAQSVLNRRGFSNHAIPIARPLQLEDADLLIDPYTLGVWLGDGTSRYASVTIGKQDEEDMIRLLEQAGHVVVRRATPMAFGIDTNKPWLHDAKTGMFVRNPKSFYAHLKMLDLVCNKHIPSQYLRASYEQRLALMQGLMDTDGYISKDGRCEFCSTSPRLAEDFYELCMSLSVKVTRRDGIVKLNGKVFDRYRFTFVPYIPVFRLKRKAELVRKPTRHSLRRYRRYIVGVDECQSVPVKCVVVDTPMHLYLAGRGMIPTHNSVLGIIKDLERLRRGMSGCLTSPDLEHFRKSIWPEFKRWCPWDRVIERHRYIAEPGWTPHGYFEIMFNNDLGGISTLGCGGCVEVDTKKWEGPNINFVHMDEFRRHKTPAAIKVFSGRVRIPGPNGEPPQLYLTTTPSKHWLFDYFGPLGCTCTDCQTDYYWGLTFGTMPTCPSCGSTQYITEDPWHNFKRDSAVVRLRTEDNEDNLYAGFARDRARSLSAAEARVLLDAEWEDLSEAETFLPSLTLWDLCREPSIPPLDARDPIVLAIDAAKGRTTSYSDCFAIVGVSRHWDKKYRSDTCVVRFVLTWQAAPGKQIDFTGKPDDPNNTSPDATIRKLCKQYNIQQIAYDPYELHDFGMRLQRDRVAWLKEFPQMSIREAADSDLLQLIIQRRIVHDGNQTLRSHIANADRKVSDDGRKFRIVKRLDHLKIDAAVALSMACYRSLHLNIA